MSMKKVEFRIKEGSCPLFCRPRKFPFTVEKADISLVRVGVARCDSTEPPCREQTVVWFRWEAIELNVISKWFANNTSIFEYSVDH